MVILESKVEDIINSSKYLIGDTAYLRGCAEEGKLCKVKVFGIDTPNLTSYAQNLVYLVRKIEYATNPQKRMSGKSVCDALVDTSEPISMVDENELVVADEAERLIKRYEEYIDERNMTRRKENDIVRNNGLITEPK